MTYDPTRELLADWAAIMRQLRARDIVRTWGVITRWIATAGAIGALASTRMRQSHDHAAMIHTNGLTGGRRANNADPTPATSVALTPSNSSLRRPTKLVARQATGPRRAPAFGNVPQAMARLDSR
jgi:hypothetical protein